VSALTWERVTCDGAQQQRRQALEERAAMVSGAVVKAQELAPKALWREEKKEMHDKVAQWHQEHQQQQQQQREAYQRKPLLEAAGHPCHGPVRVRVRARKHPITTHVGLLQHKLQALFTDAVEAFVFFNPNADQGVSDSELRRGLKMLQHKDDAVHELMRSMDTRNRDGMIDALEFTRFLSWSTIDDLWQQLGTSERRVGEITRATMRKLPAVLAALGVPTPITGRCFTY